jgi:hypothetical protein
VRSQRDLVLWRTLGVLDLVVDDAEMLNVEATTSFVALLLAVVAGFSQLFSP